MGQENEQAIFKGWSANSQRHKENALRITGHQGNENLKSEVSLNPS